MTVDLINGFPLHYCSSVDVLSQKLFGCHLFSSPVRDHDNKSPVRTKSSSSQSSAPSRKTSGVSAPAACAVEKVSSGTSTSDWQVCCRRPIVHCRTPRSDGSALLCHPRLPHKFRIAGGSMPRAFIALHFIFDEALTQLQNHRNWECFQFLK